MEEELDRIARGERAWVEVLSAFYAPFEEAVAAAQETARKEPITVPRQKKEPQLTGETCPECGADVVIRKGRYGKFKGCSNYPECKWTSPLKGKTRRGQPTDETCPQCGGDVVIRKGKYGRFRACTNYPECKWSAGLAVGTCPKCDGDLVERRGKTGIFWGCSNYPDCRYRQQPGEAGPKESSAR
jgi:DNA topoisomerase-1